MRFGVFSLVLSIALSVGLIQTQDYVVDFIDYGPSGYEYDITLRSGNCTQDAIDIFWFLTIPAVQGSCVANGTCTGSVGYLLKAGSVKCTGTDQCCFVYQSQTPPPMPTAPTAPDMPTAPTMPTFPSMTPPEFPNMTMPSMTPPTFPNMTFPSMTPPTFPNMTFPSMTPPSLPNMTMPTMPSMPTVAASGGGGSQGGGQGSAQGGTR